MQGRVGVHEGVDLDELVAAVGVAGRPGPKLTASRPRGVKSATFVQACFGSMREGAGLEQRRDERRLGDDRARGGAEDLSSASPGTIARRYSTASASSRSGAKRKLRWATAPIGDHVVGDARVEPASPTAPRRT